MAIIAIYNIKGGVGKTATSVNLSYMSAVTGHTTLLCDLDPQGSSSYYFRVKAKKKFSAEHFLEGGASLEQSIRGTDYHSLDILPADFSYRNLDISLNHMKKSRRRLKRILAPLTAEYQHIFLDCPPNITLLSENIFYAADMILIPFIPTTLSMLSFTKLLDFFKESGIDRSKLYVVFSMVEQKKKIHRNMMRHFQGRKRILKTFIPYVTDIEKMGLYRQPVPAYLPNSKAGQTYAELWQEIEKKLLSHLD
ncbi:MAG: AAA family ATPase [Candidatus Electrothrix sp. GW3-4]|uniref:ParA family protein n=1 Tax=Candidatus Electrothrix sp. GW3-4 TaxID=3126740 RepID=UPI0030D5063A